MINKEEITKNVKRLLQGYADSSNDIRVTIKNPREVDVFIDGKLFNTYVINGKKFKYNILCPKKVEDSFNMTVVISRDDLTETHSQYKGAELQLPATENELKDALERARVQNENQTYSIVKCLFYHFDLASDMKQQPLDLNVLNYLAKVMSRFSPYEHKQFRGYVWKKGLFSLELKDLVNIAYNIENSKIIDGIHDAETLGQMYADNNKLDWLKGVDKNVLKYLNYELLGEDIREKDGGIFTADGYFTSDDSCYKEVFDGSEYPEIFGEETYIFKLLINKKQSDDETQDMWLTLPVSKEGKARFLRELGAESFDDCVLLAFQSMEANIPMCVQDLSQLGLLNSLAHRMRDMEKAGEFAKFKAVLAGFGCETLEDAIKYANTMQNYELYADASTVIEYAKDVFKGQYKSLLPESFVEHFNFASYSVELSKAAKLALTEYGVIKDKTAVPENDNTEEKPEN